jgi:hypothetical protein
MLQLFKRIRLLILKIWLPVLVSIILIIVANSLLVNLSFSRVAPPRNIKVQPTSDIRIVYEALAEDIVQIFKWMETPSITPAKLAMNILRFKADDEQVYLSHDAPYVGLPSNYQTKYTNDVIVNRYTRGIDLHIGGFQTNLKKSPISFVYIKPLKFSKAEKTWYDNFSAIKFMGYLSKGIDKSDREIIDMGSDIGLNLNINLKQKYFKSSKFKKYMVKIVSSQTGAWRLPNGEEFQEERQPIISLEIDPEESY